MSSDIYTAGVSSVSVEDEVIPVSFGDDNFVPIIVVYNIIISSCLRYLVHLTPMYIQQNKNFS